MTKPNTSCVVCKKDIYRIPSRLIEHNACSISCRNKWFSKDLHPRWKGGTRDLQKTRLACTSRRLRHKIKAVSLLGGRCSKCGYSACLSALDFHHKDPLLKTSTLKDLMVKRWVVIESEIRKCILLCANCHRELHSKGTLYGSGN